MKITVLGAAGKMAPGVIRDLAEAPEVKEIVLVDLTSTRQVLEQRANDWGNNKAEAVFADIADPESLRAAMRGSKALANCTIYYFNLQVMEACLPEGVHYADMGELFHVCRKQIPLFDQWKA